MNPVLALLLRIPLHGLGLLAALTPRSLEMSLGKWGGRLAMVFDRKRRRIAEDNIARCLPELSAQERARLLRENFEHYGRMVLELSHMFAPIPGHFKRYVLKNVRVEGLEEWRAVHARGKGSLYVSSHIANWEFAAAIGSLHGMVVMIVTRHLKPKWLDEWMAAVRESVGVSAAYQPRTVPSVMKHLRAGHGVVFVMDQYMPPPMGEPMRLFGVNAHTLAAIAPLARRTEAGVLPVRARRGEDGIVTVTIEPEMKLSDDDKADNQRFAHKIEDWMRENPAQSLWGHRRFKDVDWSDRVPRRAQAA